MNLKLNRELQDLCINTIRILSADAVQNANAGHPGMPMGAAAMAYMLWTRFSSIILRTRSGSIAIGLYCPGDTAPCCCTACCT